MTTKIYIILLTMTFAFQQKSFGQANVSDTIFISRSIYGGLYHAIYIDSNKKSKYYEMLINFEFDTYDSLYYQESINSILKENPAKLSKVTLPSSLPRQWCGLNSYKDDFYLYAPSDWGNNSNAIITDTTIIEYFMEGPYAHIIDSFKAIDESTFEFSVRSAYRATTKFTIHIIDKKNQIAIFDNHTEGENYRYSLMVGSSKARQFLIIVNYCKNRIKTEFDFDKINFNKLLKTRKRKILHIIIRTQKWRFNG